MKAVRLIWLSGSLTAEERYHAAKALFESGLADWETARKAVDRIPGIFVASDDLGKIDEIVRQLREAGLQPQVTEREGATAGRPAADPAGGAPIQALPERLEDVLRSSLVPGETVEVTLHYGGQALVVTGERVMLIEVAALASPRTRPAGRVESLPFSRITSAEVRAGWVGGQIRITAQAPGEHREGWLPGVEEATFVFQEERLRPLARIAVEKIKERARKAQEAARGDVRESSSRRS